MATEIKRTDEGFGKTSGQTEDNSYSTAVAQNAFSNSSDRKSHIADAIGGYAQYLQGENRPKTFADAIGSLIPGYDVAKRAVGYVKKGVAGVALAKKAYNNPKEAVKAVLGEAAKAAGKKNPLLEPLINSIPEKFSEYQKAQQEDAAKPTESTKQKLQKAFINAASEHLPGGNTPQGKTFINNVINDPEHIQDHVNDLLTASIPDSVRQHADTLHGLISDPRQLLTHPALLEKAGIPVSEVDKGHLDIRNFLQDNSNNPDAVEIARGFAKAKGPPSDDPVTKALFDLADHPNDEYTSAALENVKNRVAEKYLNSQTSLGPNTKDLIYHGVRGTATTDHVQAAAQEFLPDNVKNLIENAGTGSPDDIENLKQKTIAAGKEAAKNFATTQVKKQVTQLATKYVPGIETPDAQKFVGKVLEDPTNIKSHVQDLISDQADPVIAQHLKNAQNIRDGAQTLLTDPRVLKQYLPEITPEQENYIQTLKDVHTAATGGRVSQNLKDTLEAHQIFQGDEEYHELVSKPLNEWSPDELSNLAPPGINQHPLFKSLAYYTQHTNDAQTPAALEMVKKQFAKAYIDQNQPDLPESVKALAVGGFKDASSETLLNAAKDLVPSQYKGALDLAGKGTTPDLTDLQRQVVQKGIDNAPITQGAKFHVKTAYNQSLHPSPDDPYAPLKSLGKAAAFEAQEHVDDPTLKALIKRAPDLIDALPGGKNEPTFENIKRRIKGFFGRVKDQASAEVEGVQRVGREALDAGRTIINQGHDVINETVNKLKQTVGAHVDEAKATVNDQEPDSPTNAPPNPQRFQEVVDGQRQYGDEVNEQDVAEENERRNQRAAEYLAERAAFAKHLNQYIQNENAPEESKTVPNTNPFFNDDVVEPSPVNPFNGGTEAGEQEIPAAKARAPPSKMTPEEIDASLENAINGGKTTPKPGVTDEEVDVGKPPPEEPEENHPEEPEAETELRGIGLNEIEDEEDAERDKVVNQPSLEPPQRRPANLEQRYDTDNGLEPQQKVKRARVASPVLTRPVRGPYLQHIQPPSADDRFNPYGEEFADEEQPHLTPPPPSALLKARVNLLNTVGDVKHQAAVGLFHARTAVQKIESLFTSKKPDEVEEQPMHTRQINEPEEEEEPVVLPKQKVQAKTPATDNLKPPKNLQEAVDRTNGVPQEPAPAEAEAPVFQDGGGDGGFLPNSFNEDYDQSGAYVGDTTQAAENLIGLSSNKTEVASDNPDEGVEGNTGNTFNPVTNDSSYEESQRVANTIGQVGGILAPTSLAAGKAIGLLSKKSPVTKPTTNSAEDGETTDIGGESGIELQDVVGGTGKTATSYGSPAADALVDTGEAVGESAGETAAEAIPELGALVAAGVQGYSLYQALTTSPPSPTKPDVFLGSAEDVLPTYQASSNASTGITLGSTVTPVQQNAVTASDALDDQVNEFTG